MVRVEVACGFKDGFSHIGDGILHGSLVDGNDHGVGADGTDEDGNAGGPVFHLFLHDPEVGGFHRSVMDDDGVVFLVIEVIDQ